MALSLPNRQQGVFPDGIAAKEVDGSAVERAPITNSHKIILLSEFVLTGEVAAH